MKARREEVAKQVLDLCTKSAKRKGSRVKKLNDMGAREAVINGAAFRLLSQIDYFFPRALRQRLRLQTFGNITVPCNIDLTLWLAWVLVHRYYICLGTFWFEESDARDALVDRALDAERKAYIRASKTSGGSELLDPTTQEDLARFTEDGNAFASEPEYLREQELLEAQEAAADDAREKIEAQENERLREARNAYGETLEIRHRRALYLICNDPRATNSTIAAQVGIRSVKGIKQETVRKIREKLTELADAILTIPTDAFEALQREVEALKKEMAELRAARRRDQWLSVMSVEEFETFRTSTFLASFCEAFGTTPDGVLGANTDASLSASIIGPKSRAIGLNRGTSYED